MKLGEIYTSIPDEGFKILAAIERGLNKYEYVPVSYIYDKTRIHAEKLNVLLNTLNNIKVIRRKLGTEVGYRLTYLGLNVLSLHSLARRGIIVAIGNVVGIGKESEVYEALGPGNIRLSIKFHMVGKTSFKKTEKSRAYVLERELPNWISESKLSAQREYRALEKLSVETEYVCKPIAYNRNAVVTEFIEGIELYKLKNISNPLNVFNKIIEVIKIAYRKANIIHGDLSEYNVMIKLPEEDPIIIDWPQYFYAHHPNAELYLRRDVCQISNFFKKRFGLNIDCDEVLEQVKNFA